MMDVYSSSRQRFGVHGFLTCDRPCQGSCLKINHNQDLSDVISSSGKKLLSMIKNGIASKHRGPLWAKLLGADLSKQADYYNNSVMELWKQFEEYDLSFADGLEVVVSKIDTLLNKSQNLPLKTLRLFRQILMDVDRTFPNHQMFLSNDKRKTQQTIFTILAVYAQYNPQVGYCQGMAYIAAVLVMNVDNEETAFWCLVKLLDNQDHYHMMFHESLRRVRLLAEILKILINRKHPDLGKHLDSIGVHPLMYSTQWFMTLFTSLNCWDTVLFISDMFVFEAELLVMSSLNEALPFLQDIPARLIHRAQFQHAFLQYTLKSIKDIDKYVAQAEVRMKEEEEQLEQNRLRYLNQRSGTQVSLDSSGSPKDPAGGGVLNWFINKFTPAPKKRRTDDDEADCNTPLRNTTKQVLNVVSVSKPYLDSVRKGRAELRYTPESGLIYTSPNTIEMTNITDTPATRSSRKRPREDLAIKEAIKLSFDSPTTKSSPLMQRVYAQPSRRSPRLAKNYHI